jgi:type IV pilus assembly protein PilB
MWVPVGCSECSGLGFKGRIGVFEAIVIDEEIEKAVLVNPSERDIREAAKDQKLLSLVEDGVIKVLSGVTTLEELDRVVDLSLVS